MFVNIFFLHQLFHRFFHWITKLSISSSFSLIFPASFTRFILPIIWTKVAMSWSMRSLDFPNAEMNQICYQVQLPMGRPPDLPLSNCYLVRLQFYAKEKTISFLGDQSIAAFFFPFWISGIFSIKELTTTTKSSKLWRFKSIENVFIYVPTGRFSVV